jgi:hypothetical protein
MATRSQVAAAHVKNRERIAAQRRPAGEPKNFSVGDAVLLGGSGLFVLATLFFGTKGGYYDTDKYDGNGTAH